VPRGGRFRLYCVGWFPCAAQPGLPSPDASSPQVARLHGGFSRAQPAMATAASLVFPCRRIPRPLTRIVSGVSEMAERVARKPPAKEPLLSEEGEIADG